MGNIIIIPLYKVCLLCQALTCAEGREQVSCAFGLWINSWSSLVWK